LKRRQDIRVQILIFQKISADGKKNLFECETVKAHILEILYYETKFHWTSGSRERTIFFFRNESDTFVF